MPLWKALVYTALLLTANCKIDRDEYSEYQEFKNNLKTFYSLKKTIVVYATKSGIFVIDETHDTSDGKKSSFIISDGLSPKPSNVMAITMLPASKNRNQPIIIYYDGKLKSIYSAQLNVEKMQLEKAKLIKDDVPDLKTIHIGDNGKKLCISTEDIEGYSNLIVYDIVPGFGISIEAKEIKNLRNVYALYCHQSSPHISFGSYDEMGFLGSLSFDELKVGLKSSISTTELIDFDANDFMLCQNPSKYAENGESSPNDGTVIPHAKNIWPNSIDEDSRTFTTYILDALNGVICYKDGTTNNKWLNYLADKKLKHNHRMKINSKNGMIEIYVSSFRSNKIIKFNREKGSSQPSVYLHNQLNEPIHDILPINIEIKKYSDEAISQTDKGFGFFMSSSKIIYFGIAIGAIILILVIIAFTKRRTTIRSSKRKDRKARFSSVNELRNDQNEL